MYVDESNCINVRTNYLTILRSDLRYYKLNISITFINIALYLTIIYEQWVINNNFRLLLWYQSPNRQLLLIIRCSELLINYLFQFCFVNSHQVFQILTRSTFHERKPDFDEACYTGRVPRRTFTAKFVAETVNK